MKYKKERHWGLFHKAIFQWQMTKISDKFADNQSNAMISVDYNSDCNLFLITSFVKKVPDLHDAYNDLQDQGPVFINTSSQ